MAENTDLASISPTNTTSTTPAYVPWWERYTPRQAALATFVSGLVLVGFGLLIELRGVVLICFVAIVIATAVQPAAERLQRVGFRQGPALVIVYIVLLAAVGGLIWLLVPLLVLQVGTLASTLPATYTNLLNTLRASHLELLQRLGSSLPPTITQTQQPGNPQSESTLAAAVISIVPLVATQILTLIVTVLLSYYWVIYRARAVQVVMLTFPVGRRDNAAALWAAVEGKVGAFVRGQFILCMAILLVSLPAYWLIGLPYAVIIAVMAGVLEAVPYIGPVVTGVLAVGMGFTASPQVALLALIVSLVIQQLESTLLVPRIMDKSVGVNPVVTLLALTAFSLLFGLLGALLAIPLAAIIQIALDRWILNAPSELPVIGRDRLAVLQYEVQQLTQDVRSQIRTKQSDADDLADQEEEELESILVDLSALLQTEATPLQPEVAS